MRQTPVIAATAALLLLALTGCTGSPASTSSRMPVMSDGATQFPTNTPKPLVAETQAPAAASGDAQYLKDVRKALTNGRQTQIPNASDEQLIKAGHDACAAVAAGTPEAKVTVIEGETFDDNWGGYMDSSIILTIARKDGYC